MLSRVADAVYWMARYVERAENIARIVDVNQRFSLDAQREDVDQWAPLIKIMADTPRFEKGYPDFSRPNVLRFLLFDTSYANSILSCLKAARDNARSVREIISSEMWEQLNTMYILAKQASLEDHLLDAPGDFLSRIKSASHQFLGITECTMAHGEAWNFCRIGTMLERADKTTRILDVKYFVLLPEATDVGTTHDLTQWAALLRSVSAWESYLKSQHRTDPQRVAEFLLLDREFPRAVRYCLNVADYSLHGISMTPQGSFSNDVERHLGLLRSELSYAVIAEIMASGLHEYLDNLQGRLNAIGASIYETFFS